MRKIIIIFALLIIFPGLCLAGSLQEAQKAIIAKKNAGGAPACTNHRITVSAGANVRTTGDGVSNGTPIGSQVTPEHAGTITALYIGFYSTGVSSTATCRWKKNATNGNDLSSGLIDTITSGAVTSSGLVTFNVTDTTITTGDTFTWGCIVSAFAELKLTYTTNGSANEVGWSSWSATSYVLDDSTNATDDYYFEYDLCY